MRLPGCLSREGVTVVLAARRRDRLDALAAKLGEKAVAITAKVGDASQVSRLFDQVRERFSGLDLLLNNARSASTAGSRTRSPKTGARRSTPTCTAS
jgi:NADP-dependent 3-hydroxy acid dehydrogenase YdfG